MEKLQLIAKQLVSAGKGILAADESTPTCTTRFHGVGVESNITNRNAYRSMLFSTHELEQYISGVILFDETFHQQQKGEVNTTIPQYLNKKNILAGIKLDTGAKVLANHDPEKITEGLDGLRQRIINYRDKGASFSKWRAVITIGNDIPTKACIHANAHALARYASLCQENGLVPIVEPEILMNGTHKIQQCYDVTNDVLECVFQELKLLKVNLSAIILKPNMVLTGDQSGEQIDDKTIAKMTFEVLEKNVPKSVPGIAFLSGGQSSDLAAKRLNMLNQIYLDKRPWSLTFSYGRALQQDALSAWAKKDNKTAQEALIYRAKMNHLASTGALN